MECADCTNLNAQVVRLSLAAEAVLQNPHAELVPRFAAPVHLLTNLTRHHAEPALHLAERALHLTNLACHLARLAHHLARLAHHLARLAHHLAKLAHYLATLAPRLVVLIVEV